MCPMCERRALMLEQQQAVQDATSTHVVPKKVAGLTSTHSSGIASYFRNPFKTCKSLTNQCCSPQCESQRSSVHSMRGARRSSVRPSLTPPHSGDLADLDDEFRVSESPLSEEAPASTLVADFKNNQEGFKLPGPQRQPPGGKKKRRGLLKKLKRLTHGSSSASQNGPPGKGNEMIDQLDPSFSEEVSSFTACGKKVISVVHDLEHEARRRESSEMPPPSDALLYIAESDVDTISELSLDLTETNVSETTMISMMNLNGSFSSPCVSYYGTLRSSTYDDDASSFAIVPRTSINSSWQDWASDASGLSDRFGELDIGYLSLEESGEAPDFDDTVSISSSQPDDLDLNLHPGEDTVSESELDQDYSINTDSQEWFTETEDAASILHRTRAPSKHHNPDLVNTQPVHPIPNPSNHFSGSKEKSNAKEETKPAEKVKPPSVAPKTTEHICSQCGRKEEQTMEQQEQQATTKKVTRKDNPMSAYFHTYMKGADHAVVAAKVVVLLGKYGNRKGLRVAGLPPAAPAKELPGKKVDQLSEHELDRLKNIMSPSDDAVTAFQNEVARMMLEGVDVPALNMDVEQFLAGYMKLHSPFYIDLIEDFFKSVCMDCFGQMDSDAVKADPFQPEPRRPTSCAVLSQRKRKSTILSRS